MRFVMSSAARIMLGCQPQIHQETIVLEIIDADFNNPEHGRQVLAMLNEYASGPMGGNSPLPAFAQANLIAELARRPTAHALLARIDGEPAGVAIYIEGFSTFACRPLINLHDLGVAAKFQGQGVGKHLLSALEDRARRLGCCKITLEVLEGNAVAQGLYRKLGFEGYALDEATGRAMFWQKKLAA
ncbi:Acetyltransferase YpeA [compost metagenome]